MLIIRTGRFEGNRFTFPCRLTNEHNVSENSFIIYRDVNYKGKKLNGLEKIKVLILRKVLWSIYSAVIIL